MMHNCPICQHKSNSFYTDKSREFFQCEHCLAVFCPVNYFPDADFEKARYERHNNDVDDPRYQAFVQPVVDAVKANFSPKHKGLDYGAGTGPVATMRLRESDYQIALYDPFFYPDKTVLKDTYDYVFACEVIEHFHHPIESFQEMHNLLKPGGKLICMTSIFHEQIHFKTWRYKNDKTHVLFYHEKSLAYLKSYFGFKSLEIDGKLAVFSV